MRTQDISDHLISDLLATLQATSASGGDHTDLSTSRSISTGSRGVTNVLMVTTTVRMLNGVHSHTTHVRPAVTLHSVLVVSTASLEHRLIGTSTTGNEANHGAARGLHSLLHTRRKTDAGGAVSLVVGDDGGVVAGGTSDATSVTGLLLNVADDGTLGDRGEVEHVADSQLSLGTTVDELASVHTLSSNEELLLGLELVGVSEGHASKRGTTSRVVDDLLDNTLGVSMAFSIVQRAELSCTLASTVVGLEDSTSAFTLASDLPFCS